MLWLRAKFHIGRLPAPSLIILGYASESGNIDVVEDVKLSRAWRVRVIGIFSVDATTMRAYWIT